MKIILVIVIALSGVGCSTIHTLSSAEKYSGDVAILQGEYRTSVKEPDLFPRQILKSVLIKSVDSKTFNTSILQPLILKTELIPGPHTIEVECLYESRRYPPRRRGAYYKTIHVALQQLAFEAVDRATYRIMCNRTLDKDYIWIEAMELGVIDR